MRPLRALPCTLVAAAAALAGAAGPAEARETAISADGRHVAAAGSTGEPYAVLLYDRRTGTAQEAARASDEAGGGVSQHQAYAPAISDDGRYVTFTTTAPNLGEEGTRTRMNVVVRDTATGTTTLITRGANDGSYDPAISADGRHIAFSSSATTLDPGDRRRDLDVYVHDRQTGRTELVRRPRGASSAIRPAISGDGRRIAFIAEHTPAGRRAVRRFLVHVHDRAAGTMTTIARSARRAEPLDRDEVDLSRDGRHVAYVTRRATIEVADLVTGRTDVVSRASGSRGRIAGWATEPSLSADGRRVAFVSAGIDPVDASPEDDRMSVYVRDTQTGRTTLVSRDETPDAHTLREYSESPAISGDGAVVAYAWDGFPRLVPGMRLQVGTTEPPRRPRLTIGDALRFPATRSCRDRRTVAVGVQRIRGRVIRRVRITSSQDGVRRTRTWRRPTGTLVLRRLTGARVVLTVRVELTNGSVLTGARRLGGCRPRR